MPAKRLTMRKLREILRLRLDSKLTIRPIARVTDHSVGAIQRILSEAERLNVSWADVEGLDDTALLQLFYPGRWPAGAEHFAVPNWAEVSQQLKAKGVTRQLLWEEYNATHMGRAYSRTQFFKLFRAWQQKQKRSMRQIHMAGEKCFVDYCGHTLPVVNPLTGAVREVQVFVATLGASSYTFAEATESQKVEDWLGSHVRMLKFFGGVPEMIVPDNLKSGVTHACRYDPDLNPSYQQWATHYATAVVPARPRKPQDKAKVENAVQVVERWIMARLRHHTFFSLAEVNQCIQALLIELNERPFKQLPGCRREAFEQLDQPALKPLPPHDYQFQAMRRVRVGVDYHVQLTGHFYSVPHALVGEQLELWYTDKLVEVRFKRNLVASHPRSTQHGITTSPHHMPDTHRHQHEWTPARLQQWAVGVGPSVAQWVRTLAAAKDHPEQAHKICKGLLGLAERYPSHRLDAACVIANREGLLRLKHIKAILTSNRDRLADTDPLQISLPQSHENIRGPETFH